MFVSMMCKKKNARDWPPIHLWCEHQLIGCVSIWPELEVICVRMIWVKMNEFVLILIFEWMSIFSVVADRSLYLNECSGPLKHWIDVVGSMSSPKRVTELFGLGLQTLAPIVRPTNHVRPRPGDPLRVGLLWVLNIWEYTSKRSS